MARTPDPSNLLPIPTYEEAIASQPTSSQSRRGPEEISDDAERQGLLGERSERTPTPRRHNYAPPTVESARPSIDSLDGLDRQSDDGLRREMQQMEIEEPESAQHSLLRHRLSKRFSSLTSSFSSLRVPSFRRYLPSLNIRVTFENMSENKVVIFGRLFGLFLIISIMWLLVASDVVPFRKNRNLMGQIYDPEAVRIYVQDHMNLHGNIQGYLEHITSFPHIAGTEGGFVLAEWIAEQFRSSDLENVEMERFDVYLNYPRKDDRRVSIISPDSQRWEAHLEERREETLVFHGLSKWGDVTGPLVYANFGSDNDFKNLSDNGISVEGKIALVRYYGTQTDRAMKVKAAELAGAVGCIIYSDPTQDGFVKGPVFPDGRFTPTDGVQRGTVALTPWLVGDVLSPGWPSLPDNGERLEPSESAGLNKIPSLPISWDDAQHLLEALKGRGKQMTAEWTGVPGIEYWTGDGDLPEVNLLNLQDEEKYQPIYNVLGRIAGWEQPDKRIIVGNHHDAWCAGAADPGTGTAVMLEIVRVFGDLRRIGWRPLRTIEFASWDAEEYNLIGSTEHVENRLEDLRLNGFAYLNVDVAATGNDFHVAASPIFERPLKRVLGRVVDPSRNETIKDVWEKSGRGIEGLGAGSDHVAFQDISGTSSIDMTFSGEPYPYHSCYDNFEWMVKFGDPDFNYATLMAQIWALLILEIADEPVLPFAMTTYSNAVTRYISDLESYISTKSARLDLSPLHTASSVLATQATSFDSWSREWTNFIMGTQGFESAQVAAQRVSHNNRAASFETDLLDLSEGGGLVNRTQFKHVLFAPDRWSGYDEAFFPGVRDMVEVGDWDGAQNQVVKIAGLLRRAAEKLND